MKKIVAMLVVAACTLSAMATDYKGKLAVSINGEGGAQEANITLNKQDDGKYTLLIKNFVLADEETELGIGNIELNNLDGTEQFGFTTLKTNESITITEGDAPDIYPWMGPMLGEVPIALTASFNEQLLNVDIDIYFEPLEQTIKVNFIGTTPQQGGVKGDVTGEGEVDVNDVNAVINIMLGKD